MSTWWTGKGSTVSWDDAANWSTGAVPYFYDSVVIGLSGSTLAIAVPILSASRAGSLTIGDGGSSETVRLNLAGAFPLNGGSLTVASGATLVTGGGAINLNGGDFSIAANAAYSQVGGTLTINSLTVNGTATLTGTVVVGGEAVSGSGVIDINGGTLGSASDLLSVGTGTPSFTIENGGTLGLRTAGSVSLIRFGSGANTLIMERSAGSIGTPITGFGAGDTIKLEQGNITSDVVTSNRDGTYTISLYTNPYYAAVVFTHVTLAAGTTAAQVAFKASGGETLVYVACFLSGTRIETEAGEIAVEDLAVGDSVVTLEIAGHTAGPAGERVLRPVRWLGHSRIDLGGLDEHAARQAAPVRVCAHAFAQDVPARDLLITPEHCILVDGGLIPARMLVNGASIVRDYSVRHYTVHHIECDRHAILLSDGLTTESYLDTGNRASFAASAKAVHDAAQGSATWASHAAAPLTTARDVVEPIWRRLLARAEQLGLQAPAMPARAEVARPSALHLELEDGTVLRARRCNGERHFFVLPAGTGRAILVSANGVPSEIEGPFVDDRRRLGVLVESATLWKDLRSAALSLGSSRLRGWHPPEQPDRPSWTDGRAEIDFDPVSQPTVLEVMLAGRYPSSCPMTRAV